MVRKNYKNKVCFIQSEQVFEWEEDDEGLSTVRDYLKIKKSQFLESNDVAKIYKFIHNHATNSIRKFVCHVDSEVLEKLMDKMVEEKKNSSSVRSLLNKCTFVATYSNANPTRDKNKATGSMFYFSLGDLSSVLDNIPNGKVKENARSLKFRNANKPADSGRQFLVAAAAAAASQENEQDKDIANEQGPEMAAEAEETVVLTPLDVVEAKEEKEIILCISKSVSTSPYYQQIDQRFIENDFTTVKKVIVDTNNDNDTNKLSPKILDEFAGYLVIASLNGPEEYQKFTDDMLKSSYRKQLLFIENTRPEITASLERANFSSIQICSSGVCINAPPFVYPGLNVRLSYEVCAAILTVCWKSWSKFKKAGVLALK
jgi:hypothetical protein